jgi:hypothetical protein
MDCIYDKNQKSIPEWKGINWELDDENSMSN